MRNQKWRVDQIKEGKKKYTLCPLESKPLIPLWYINKTQIKTSQLFKSLLKKKEKKRFSDIVAVWAINHSHKEEEEQEKIFRFLRFLVISRSFLSPSLSFLTKIKERNIALRCDSDRVRERERVEGSVSEAESVGFFFKVERERELKDGERERMERVEEWGPHRVKVKRT